MDLQIIARITRILGISIGSQMQFGRNSLIIAGISFIIISILGLFANFQTNPFLAIIGFIFFYGSGTLMVWSALTGDFEKQKTIAQQKKNIPQKHIKEEKKAPVYTMSFNQQE